MPDGKRVSAVFPRDRAIALDRVAKPRVSRHELHKFDGL